MHPGTAHLLQGDLLADHHLGHPGRTEIHRGILLDHDHQVGEGGDVGPAGGRGPEQAADLRHLARELDLVAEDPPRPAAAREELHLIGDPGTGGVDEPEDRQFLAERRLGDPDDLLHRPRAPAAGLHRRVVGDHQRRPALDQAAAGDHTVGGQIAGQGIGQLPVLDEGALVEEQRDPVPDEQLVLAVQLGPGLLAQGSGGGPSRVDVGSGADAVHHGCSVPSFHSAGRLTRPAGRGPGRSASAAPPRCPPRSPGSWRRDRTGPPGIPR